MCVQPVHSPQSYGETSTTVYLYNNKIDMAPYWILYKLPPNLHISF